MRGRGREAKRGPEQHSLSSAALHGGAVAGAGAGYGETTRHGSRDKGKAPRLSTPELNERLRLEKLRQYEGQRPEDAYRYCIMVHGITRRVADPDH
jgi:hypothetical protein